MMKRRLRTRLLGGWLLLVATAATAQLTWERTEQEFQPPAAMKAVTGKFAFHNQGNYPVTVLSVKTTCGCIVAKLAEKVYAPGTAGAIEFTMETPREGLVRKYIVVETDDREHPSLSLAVVIVRPEYVRMTPRYLTWAVNDVAAPQTVEITVIDREPLKITGVDVNRAAFDYILETVVAGRQYRLTVVPRGTSRLVYGVLRLETVPGRDIVGDLLLFARVLRPVE